MVVELAVQCACNFLVRCCNDVSPRRIKVATVCLLLDARGRQTYQLTPFKPQPQLSQKKTAKSTATHALIHCIMHPPAQFVELLLTHDTSGLLQTLIRGYIKLCHFDFIQHIYYIKYVTVMFRSLFGP